MTYSVITRPDMGDGLRSATRRRSLSRPEPPTMDSKSMEGGKNGHCVRSVTLVVFPQDDDRNRESRWGHSKVRRLVLKGTPKVVTSKDPLSLPTEVRFYQSQMEFKSDYKSYLNTPYTIQIS